TAVDWLRVSQATGLSIRECLEHSQYDVGKAHWRYNPDLSSQSMADRMTSFINEHYPSPIPVNYRAMSNYLWIDLDDCMRMYGIFRGKFKWTTADLERAAEFRAQGLTFKEIARHLSPRLPGSSVRYALRRHSQSKPAAVPISADELREMSRLVDEYAGKHSVVEIVSKIRAQLSLTSKPSYFGKIVRRIAAHPHYKAKLRDIDYNDLANWIALGQTTVKLTAKELDVPRPILAMNIQSMHSKLYASQWTEEETRKLVDYTDLQTQESQQAYADGLGITEFNTPEYNDFVSDFMATHANDSQPAVIIARKFCKTWPRPSKASVAAETIRVAVMDSSFNPPHYCHGAHMEGLGIMKVKAEGQQGEAHALDIDAFLLILGSQNADKPLQGATLAQRMHMVDMLAAAVAVDTTPDMWHLWKSRDQFNASNLHNMAIGMVNVPRFVDKCQA
ncbi:hypothetical protein GGF38_001749, partial [Coemansia sp. RSA 25]